MSALGHKRTYAVQKGMSALPLKADMCGATRDVSFANTGHRGHLTLSAKEISPARNGEVKRFGGLEIDHKLKFRRLKEGNEQMRSVARQLTNEEIASLAAYYSSIAAGAAAARDRLLSSGRAGTDRHRDISRRQKQGERGTLLEIETFSYGLLWQCA